MIVGCGVDIVELQRIHDLIDQQGDRFIGRVFTEGEIGYCRAKARYWQHFAGRFAVKEAVFKSLGTGLRKGMSFRDVEVSVDAMGAPSITIRGGTAAVADKLQVTRWHVSISHSDNYAVAQAIAERES